MKVIADLTVSPFGAGISVSKYIAACHKIIEEAGLKSHLHAYGTNLEGEWDIVLGVVKQCHEKLHEMGVPRITSSMKIGTRTDKDQTMLDKIESVEKKLNI